MKKLISLIAVLALMIAMLPLHAVPVSAETPVTELYVSYREDDVRVSTALTGRQVSADLKNAISVYVDNPVYYVDVNYSYLAKRQYNGTSYSYVSLKESDENLNMTDEYYFVFNVEERSGYCWDVNNIPEAYVNREEADDVQWYSPSPTGSVNVCKRVYAIQEDYVSSVTVYPGQAKIKKGNAFWFTADVKGSVSDVVWSLSGANSPDTYVNNGRLYVSADETASFVTVRATSAFDSSVYGEATAEITDYDIYISEVSVSPSSYSMYPGETANFSAVVTGTDYPDVTWQVSGYEVDSRVFSTGATTCTLAVPKTETASTLILTATSVMDPTVSGQAVITLEPLPCVESVSIDFDISSVVLNGTKTGSEVSEDLRAVLETAVINDSSQVFIDYNYSSLAIKSTSGTEPYYLSISYSEEPLDPEEEYYLRINIEEKDTVAWDTGRLPNVTVNGRPADDVQWYSQTPSGSVDVFVRVYFEGSGLRVLPYPASAFEKDVNYLINGGMLGVRYDKPCSVGYMSEGRFVAIPMHNLAAGEEYTTYIYLIPQGVEEVVLTVKGDATLDGKFSNADATKIKSYLKEMAQLNALQIFAADANGDGNLSNADATKIKAVLKETGTISW